MIFFISIFIFLSIFCAVVFFCCAFKTKTKEASGKYEIYFGKLIDSSGLSKNINSKKLIVIQETIFLLALAFSIILTALRGSFSIVLLLMPIPLAVILPILYLQRKTRERKEMINRSIPFFADLLTLSCEAGLDIFASLQSIMQNFDSNPLKEEIESIIKEIKMGKSRQIAVKEAYKRSSISDLKTIYLTIFQSEALGTPIGRSLRSQVEIMRHERMNRAEKLAQEAPLKLMVPLLFLIFPVTLIVLLSPIIIKFMQGNII